MKYFYLYISLLVLLLLFNKTHRINKLIHTSNTTQFNDSILGWIEASKNRSFSYTKRKEFLDKSLVLLHKETNDSLENSLLLKISLAYYSLGDSSGFRKVNKRSIYLSNKLKDSTSLAANYWDLGEFYSKNNIRDSAYYYFSKAQKLYELLGNSYYSGRMLLNTAIIQSDIKDFTGSEISTIKAISHLKPLQAHKHLYRCYNNLAINFNQLGEYEESLYYHNKALEYQKR